MKKVININLGGFPHTIDDDAYDLLDKYLKSLQRHFRGSTGYENIIQDIEVRMSELLHERRGTRKIIEMTDVQHAINIMGQPEQLDDDPDTSHTQSAFSNSDDYQYAGSRRLYRDPDHKVLGGVSGGLAAYFGWESPIWIRLGFLLAGLAGFGTGVLIYIILWIAVPVAKTSAEKLAMKGEPVNINSIANKIQDDLEDLSKRISDLGQEFRSR